MEPEESSFLPFGSQIPGSDSISEGDTGATGFGGGGNTRRGFLYGPACCHGYTSENPARCLELVPWCYGFSGRAGEGFGSGVTSVWALVPSVRGHGARALRLLEAGLGGAGIYSSSASGLVRYVRGEGLCWGAWRGMGASLCLARPPVRPFDGTVPDTASGPRGYEPLAR